MGDGGGGGVWAIADAAVKAIAVTAPKYATFNIEPSPDAE
jgi:hypothetical protein